MARRESNLTRTAGFAAAPLLSVFATLALLPTISTRFGAAGWTALALGQSIGAFASVLVGMAWPVIGSYLVASGSPARRRLIFWYSLVTRSAVLLTVAVPAILLTLYLVPENRAAAGLFTLATMLNGLTFAWFYAGIGKPGMLLRNEAMVRLGGQAVALVVLLAGGPLLAYGLISVAAGVTMVLLAWHSILGSNRARPPMGARRVRAIARSQVRGMTSRLFVAAGTYLNPTIVAAVAPGLTSAFAGLDQTRNAAGNAAAALPHGLARWTGESKRGSATALRRVRYAFWVGTVVGAVAVGLWALLGGVVVDVLFAGLLRPSETALLLTGACIALHTMSQFYALVALVPLGRERDVYSISAVSAVLGLFLTAAGAALVGLDGAMTGLASALALQAALLAAAFWREIARVRREAPDAAPEGTDA